MRRSRHKTRVPKRLALKPLDEVYRARAIPPGTARYWSWLFAARTAKDPLVGIYSLMAEWRAVVDPATDAAVAQIKLAWWRDELARLSAGIPAHPITRYLAQWSMTSAQIAPLQRSIDAASAQVLGAPLERGADLPSHADAMYGVPLRVAVVLDGQPLSSSAQACTAALAVGEYLARTLADYRRECRGGRVPFPVDELLAAGIDNHDLAADTPPPQLQAYLESLRQQAVLQFATAETVLAAPERSSLRHLSVLACLGSRHVDDGISPASSRFRWSDLYHAWKVARRAANAP